MHYEKTRHPEHSGTESFMVTLALKEQDDLYDVRGTFVRFTIHPETVTLVWERRMQQGVCGEWRRVGYRPRGPFSAFEGPRVMKDGSLSTSDRQRAVVEVFSGSGLTAYAATLPHLEQLIAELEKNLPA